MAIIKERQKITKKILDMAAEFNKLTDRAANDYDMTVCVEADANGNIIIGEIAHIYHYHKVEEEE